MVFLLGAYAVNPFNGEEGSHLGGEFCAAEYGTGAIMAVPAHVAGQRVCEQVWVCRSGCVSKEKSF